MELEDEKGRLYEKLGNGFECAVDTQCVTCSINGMFQGRKKTSMAKET